MSHVKAIPEGMHSITPALTLKDAARALALYEKAFGAEVLDVAKSPDGSGIWHSTIQIGDSRIMINDEMPAMGVFAYKVRLWLYVEDVDASFKRAVDAGLTVAMPVSDMFWGDRWGRVDDAFGVEWNLATRVKNMTPAEQSQAQADFVAQMKTAAAAKKP